MKFYEIDPALQEAVQAADKSVRVKIEIAFAGYFESVFEQDIVEAHFYGLKEVSGGTSARGEVLLYNPQEIYTYTGAGPGTQVKISFSLGNDLPYFQRFVFYIDDKGIQDIRGPGRKRYVQIGLQDLSARLKKTDEARDWTAQAVFTYSVVCDKTRPEKSLVHLIAKRAGLQPNDIDCSTIPVTLPYVRLRKNIWAELSALAMAYRCHLECAPEKPLVFAHSPYQINEQLTDNNEQSNEDVYALRGGEIFYLRKTSCADQYRNSVRLKVNMPVTLEKQEIWRYDEPPVLYDDFLQAHYPFKYPLEREIEKGKYEAQYRVIDNDGKVRNVVYADLIDTKEEAENRFEYDGGPFAYVHYDIVTNHDRAMLTLNKENDGDLYKAAIHGRPIVQDLNRSCFMTDTEAVNQHGTAALNVTGTYFSDYVINGKPHYVDWTNRELTERLQNKQEITIKTHRALFNARVGAKIKLEMTNEKMMNEKGKMINRTLTGTVNAFSFRYKRDKAFVAMFRINTNNNEK